MSKKEEQQKDVVAEDNTTVEESQAETVDKSQVIIEDREQERKEVLEKTLNGFFTETEGESNSEDEVSPEGVTQTDSQEEPETKHTLEPIKPTKKKFSLFRILTMTLIVVLLASVVVLAHQLNEREKVIQDTQEDLVATYEELSKVQTDSKDMSVLVLEQQDKLKQYEVDIKKYKTVVDARDGEIAKLETLQAETEKKVLELQKQLEELDVKFTALKDDIMLFVDEE